MHRSLAFSKYLPDFGWDVSVLTVHPRAHEQRLERNSDMVPKHVQLIRAPAWDAARHFAVAGRYPSALALPDRWSSWVPFGTRAGLAALRRQRHDAIFSTFPIASAHLIGRNLHDRSHLPWVADFRDPMATATYPHEPTLRERWTRIQDEVMARASRVTVTTPGTARYYRDRYPQARPERVVVIENGFDPQMFDGPPAAAPAPAAAGAPVVLLHSGLLYPRERDPKPFFRALRRRVDDPGVGPDAIRVCLRASGFEREYAAILAELGLSNVVSLVGPLPYADALREMQSASALLLFQAAVCNEQIPAKAYEYLYAGRPILGITDPLGDTGQLLRRFGVPGVSALEDEEGILRMLRASLPMIEAGRYPTPAREAVMAVSRKSGAELLARTLEEAVREQ